MKSCIISIQPQWVRKILNGEKTIEIRKTMPKCELPVKVYIYCTKGKSLYEYFPVNDKNRGFGLADKNYNDTTFNGKVVAEFTLNKVQEFVVGSFGCDDLEKPACMNYKQMIDYFYKPEELGKVIKRGYAWHISDLKIYDKPRELGEFRKLCKEYEDGDCWGCDFLEYSRGIDWEEQECLCDGLKPLTTAPQSWCYMEGAK